MAHEFDGNSHGATAVDTICFIGLFVAKRRGNVEASHPSAGGTRLAAG